MQTLILILNSFSFSFKSGRFLINEDLINPETRSSLIIPLRDLFAKALVKPPVSHYDKSGLALHQLFFPDWPKIHSPHILTTIPIIQV